MTISLIRRLGTRRAMLAGFLLLIALAAAGCSNNKGASFTMNWSVIWDSVVHPDGPIINGLYLTVVISIAAQILGVILGIFAALGKMARLRPARLIANLYIWFFRGTPLLVQLTMLYYGVMAAHLLSWPTIHLGPMTITNDVLAGTIILGINEGAYMAEIVRAGILSIDPGQSEAAKSLGMTYRLTMTRIVLPQAARVIIPPLGNEFNNMLKNTSLLMALSIYELYNTFNSKAALTFQTFEYMIAASIWYLFLTTLWGLVQSWIEGRFAKGTTPTSTAGRGWRERFFGVRAQPVEDMGALGGH